MTNVSIDGAALFKRVSLDLNDCSLFHLKSTLFWCSTNTLAFDSPEMIEKSGHNQVALNEGVLSSAACCI